MKKRFTWPLKRAVQSTHKPRVKTIKLGDGYEQRVRHGLNTDLPKYQITIKFPNRDEAKPAKDFLEQHGGAESFLWTPPGESEGLYKCATWRVNDQNRPVTITATFERVMA